MRISDWSSDVCSSDLGHDNLAFGVELDVETARIIIGLRAAEARNALRLRIAVRVRLLRDPAQLVDDMLRRRQVGVAHPQVDDVLARRTCCRSHRIHFGDDIGRSEEHTSALQSLMRLSYYVFCLKK